MKIGALHFGWTGLSMFAPATPAQEVKGPIMLPL